ncbi:MAG: ANTAR domain-containing protein [Nocardioidaceae bacterium]
MDTHDADGVIITPATAPESFTGEGSTSRQDSIGAYRYDVPRDAWTWTPEVYAMHGIDPGTPPTTALITERRHPEDRQAVVDLMDRTVATGARFSLLHRVLHSGDAVREIIVIGEGVPDGTGTVTVVQGFFVDLSESLLERTRRAANEAVAGAVVHRAAIEQAKGVLSLAYGLDEAEAMRMLRTVSSHSNVKVRALAERLMDRVRDGAGSSQALRRRMDDVLRVVSRS